MYMDVPLYVHWKVYGILEKFCKVKRVLLHKAIYYDKLSDKAIANLKFEKFGFAVIIIHYKSKIVSKKLYLFLSLTQLPYPPPHKSVK